MAIKKNLTSLEAFPLECPICRAESKTCNRCQAYLRLPRARWFQAAITYVYGASHPGERPLICHTPQSVLVSHYVTLASAVSLTALQVGMWQYASPALRVYLVLGIIVFAMVATGKIRSSRFHILHHGSHGDFGDDSERIGDTASFIAGNSPMAVYQPEHKIHHAYAALEDDPEIKPILRLGFKPGMPISCYWRRLWCVLFSPMHFWGYMVGRLCGNLLPTLPPSRCRLFVAVHGLLPVVSAAISIWLNNPALFLMYVFAWLIPWTIGAYWSMVLYALGLHLWFHVAGPGVNGKAAYAQRTGARFLGDPLPEPGLSFWVGAVRWVYWWLRFLVLHLLFSKLFCLNGGPAQQHDAHHLHPNKKFDWLHGAYDRQRLAAENPDTLWHNWGLFGAIANTFAHLSKMPPLRSDEYGSIPPEGLSEILTDLDNM